MSKIKLLDITDRVYQTYKDTVRDREDITIEETKKLLTRNMLLAHRANSKGYRGQMYQYGRLWFVVVDNKVVWIRNYCHTPEGWNKDENMYNHLNKELKINNASDDKTSFIKKFYLFLKKFKFWFQ